MAHSPTTIPQRMGFRPYSTQKAATFNSIWAFILSAIMSRPNGSVLPQQGQLGPRQTAWAGSSIALCPSHLDPIRNKSYRRSCELGGHYCSLFVCERKRRPFPPGPAPCGLPLGPCPGQGPLAGPHRSSGAGFVLLSPFALVLPGVSYAARGLST